MQSNILEYLENSVLKHPNKTAFIGTDYQYTFSQLHQSGRAIGSNIANEGHFRSPILVLMNRCPRAISAYLGVLYSGNYYVPIDRDMPGSRIKMIIEKTEAKFLICDETTEELAHELDYSGQVVNYNSIIQTKIEDKVLKNIRGKVIDTDPMYVVFTSGSTGQPKGVIANHRSVIDYIDQLSIILDASETTIFGNQTPLYLDASLKEVYTTMKYGCTTYIIPKQLFMFPIKLVEYLNVNKINTVCWVVSALTIISSFKVLDSMIPEHLRVVAFGSEVFPIKQFNMWKKSLPQAKFINLYGPTEGTGMCTYHIANREFSDNESIPIGIPFKNTDILLITEDDQEAIDGDIGEICIRGTSVTMGYFKDSERTKLVYTQNPLNKVYPEIIYRTGDLAKRNQYNELIFVSRKDFQIKHMGHRIELGEIESNVNQIEGLMNACCIYNKDREKIVLFYVGNITSKEIVTFLKTKLPRYMVPNKVIKLEDMPLTPNGKIDRVGLLDMSFKRKRDLK